MHCGLICGIWDWQSTIVEDLNDSQDPKHMLFCRENAFVAIYALFSDNKCPLFTRLGGGAPERGKCPLFLPFFYIGAPLIKKNLITWTNTFAFISPGLSADGREWVREFADYSLSCRSQSTIYCIVGTYRCRKAIAT